MNTLLTPWKSLQRAWSDWRRHDDEIPRFSPDLPEKESNRIEKLMHECLAARHGAVSARQHAATLGEVYLTLNETGRKNFLVVLASRFAFDQEQLKQRAAALARSQDEDAFQKNVRSLREQLVPPRQQLLQLFNALPQGVRFLIDMRAELQRFMLQEPLLKGLDYDLKQLLDSWFDVGFLRMERITWQSPAALLQKLMRYEAVHAIQSWQDMQHRLESDRHCYAFFHPALPDEPLIFVQVALVEGLAGSIQELLDAQQPEVEPEQADSAIFYSISNAQAGLRGISFGPFLIKQVVASLQRELPQLTTFSTLSPIPGFRSWLEQQLQQDHSSDSQTAFRELLEQSAQTLQVDATLAAVFDASGWQQNDALAEQLKEPLMTLCARYLHQCREKDQAPLDPVARFHLGNGARIERINWLGDTSAKGMRQSCSLMVNYLYQLEEIEKNIENYASDKQIAAASRVKKLLQQESKKGLFSGLRQLIERHRSDSDIN